MSTMSTPRRGPADPVRALMHRHRELCERAVDPLEIAAGLEAHGVTDRTAARFKHRDVFSLAEELYARVPRAEGELAPRPRPAPVRRSPLRAALWLLPGALCALTLAVLSLLGRTAPAVWWAVALSGAVLVLAAVRLCLRGIQGIVLSWCTALCGCWLIGYALIGDWLLAGLLAGGPDSLDLPGMTRAWAPLSLAFAVAPAAWCARWFAVRARLRLASSRSLGEFASRTRPLLAAAVGLFTAALLTVQLAVRLAVDEAGTAPVPAAGPAVSGHLDSGSVAIAALGMLLFTALLLATHGFPQAVTAGLGAACALEAMALGAVLAARLPGLDPLARPVELAVAGYGSAAVPAVACTAAALAALAYAATALTGASAHHREPR
ncbi:hypothetical protein [Streptomyces gobiensis]|uniref:hypothetical protein n=1 Tax=Streptomyces gobiensis TaxID=2875706 RepID=UPI001E631EB9|nr:hypothetical protein [Streptomyces gobiensis]UGY93503.1 hypothetical protein test1122_18425 [Streptomyces gobiensis]